MDPNFVVCLMLYFFFFSYLSQDLPQLIESRIGYFEPSFEAMIRSGVSFVFLRTWQVLSQSWLLYIPQEVNTQGRPKRIYVACVQTSPISFVARKGNRRRLHAGKDLCGSRKDNSTGCGRIALRRG